MKKIHITILGKAPLPIYYPIQTLEPDEVYLLGTAENVRVAERIKTFLKSQHIDCHTRNDLDAYKVKPTLDACEDIFNKIDPEAEVSVNTTGGTKPMSIAAYTVGMNHGATVIYTNAKAILNMQNDSEEELNTKVDTQTILALHGQKMKSSTRYSYDGQKSTCSQKIMKFKNFWYWCFIELMKEYDRLPEQKPKQILRDYQIKNKEGHVKFQYSYNEGNHSIDIVCGRWESPLEHKDVYLLLFEGRWWETIVADATARWAGDRYEVLQNVTFDPQSEESREEGNDKNEIDILVNIGNTFIIIECKSGKVDQDVINKMKTIRDTYASIKSKSVLVTFNPLTQDLREKADDADIFVIEALNDEGKPYDKSIYDKLPKTEKKKIVTAMINSIPQKLETIKNTKKA